MSGLGPIKKRGSNPINQGTKRSIAWGDDLEYSKDILKEVPKEQLFPDPDQPRKEIDEASLLELTASLEKHGLIQPILAIAVGVESYKILAGERRWRAAMASSIIKNITIIVRPHSDDDFKVLLTQIAENIHRANMTPLETANAYKRVFEYVGENTDEAAKLLAISKSRLSQVLAVDDASEQIKSLVRDRITNDVNVVAALNELENIAPAKAQAIIEKAKSGQLDGGLRANIKDALRDVKAERKLKAKSAKLVVDVENKSANTSVSAEATIRQITMSETMFLRLVEILQSISDTTDAEGVEAILAVLQKR